MADINTAGQEVRVEDLVPVRSRVSWASIFAGAVVALACYLVLTLLGSAIGLSISNNVRSETLGAGAAIWAVVTTIVALFIGGFVTTQCAVGENKMEAMVHGVIMWGAVLAMIMWMVATGVRSGFNAMLGVTYAGAAATRDGAQDWEAAARQAGIPQETINEWRAKARDVREAADDPATRREVRDTAATTTWWTLLGTVLSLAAAVVGSLVGSGPSFQLLGTRVVASRETYRREYANQP